MSEQEGEGVRLGPIRIPDYLRPTYANFVNVNHTPWDFRLMFALVRTPVTGEEHDAVQAEHVVHPDAVAEVVLPANLMHGFISALQDNFSRYLSQYGPPGLAPEGPLASDSE